MSASRIVALVLVVMVWGFPAALRAQSRPAGSAIYSAEEVAALTDLQTAIMDTERQIQSHTPLNPYVVKSTPMHLGWGGVGMTQ